MPRFPVTPAKQQDLENRLAQHGVREQDLQESFFHGTGRIKSGKKGVVLRHPALGIEVRCQKASSQALNRFHARRWLVEEIEARAQGKTRAQVMAERRREAALRKQRKPAKSSGPSTPAKPVSDLSAMFQLPPPPPPLPGRE